MGNGSTKLQRLWQRLTGREPRYALLAIQADGKLRTVALSKRQVERLKRRRGGQG